MSKGSFRSTFAFKTTYPYAFPIRNMKWTAQERQALEPFIKDTAELSWPAKTQKWNQLFPTRRSKEGIRGQWNREKLRLGLDSVPVGAVRKVSKPLRPGRKQKAKAHVLSMNDGPREVGKSSDVSASGYARRPDNAAKSRASFQRPWVSPLQSLKGFALCKSFQSLCESSFITRKHEHYLFWRSDWGGYLDCGRPRSRDHAVHKGLFGITALFRSEVAGEDSDAVLYDRDSSHDLLLLP